MSKMVYGL